MSDPRDWPYDWIRRARTTEPERVFLETPEGRIIRYGDLDRLTGRIAAAFVDRGIEPGDRIVVQVEKSPEAALLYLACLRTGAVFVPLNTGYTVAELDYFVADAQPRLLVVTPERLAAAQELAARHGVGSVTTLDAAGNGALIDIDASAPVPEWIASTSDQLAALVYTSGTTGRSKGAMITRGNLASNAEALAECWRFTSEDRLLHALPIYHVHGLFVAINTVLAAGASMLWLPKFEIENVLAVLPRATAMMGVPTFYTRLLDHAGWTAETVAGTRLFVSGSAPLLAQTHEAFGARTGHAILERYGMTETGMNSSNPYDGARIPGSVGPAIPGIEIRITDRDTGAALQQPDEIGGVEIRGPNVCAGYWRNPQKTAESFRPDGFFMTGDVGRIDRNSYLYLVGRAKDLIITGGFNVYPIEIEEALDAMPGIVESAVIGLPHPDFGEAVTAVIIAEPGYGPDEATIRASLSERLASFKVPKRVVAIPALPRNAMGKVEKARLRQTFEALYSTK